MQAEGIRLLLDGAATGLLVGAYEGSMVRTARGLTICQAEAGQHSRPAVRYAKSWGPP
jgi:hypothetical protein